MAWQPPKTNWGQLGQTVPGVDDFNRIEGNIAVLGQYDRAPGYGVATGENAKVITLNPAPGSYYDGLCFAFKNETQNTGAVTINVNGMGARPLKKPNGSDVATGYLKAGSIYTVRYNATTGNFILQGSDSAGNATPDDVVAGKTFSNDFDTDLVGTGANARRRASGTVMSQVVGADTRELITISGLDFVPSVFICKNSSSDVSITVVWNGARHYPKFVAEWGIWLLYSENITLGTSFTIAIAEATHSPSPLRSGQRNWMAIE